LGSRVSPSRQGKRTNRPAACAPVHFPVHDDLKNGVLVRRKYNLFHLHLFIAQVSWISHQPKTQQVEKEVFEVGNEQLKGRLGELFRDKGVGFFGEFGMGRNGSSYFALEGKPLAGLNRLSDDFPGCLRLGEIIVGRGEISQDAVTEQMEVVNQSHGLPPWSLGIVQDGLNCFEIRSAAEDNAGKKRASIHGNHLVNQPVVETMLIEKPFDFFDLARRQPQKGFTA
jgi:hypothetical protein